MPAVKKVNPSRVLARMETSAKRYPKFVHQNQLASLKDEEWEPLSQSDPDVHLVGNDVENPNDRVTAPAPHFMAPTARPEEKSEVRLLAALNVPPPLPGSQAPSVAPMPFMSNSAFESLLASSPPAPTLAIPPADLRSSMRPTVPLGPPAMLVVSRADVEAQKLATAARLARLFSSRPNEPLALAPPAPPPRPASRRESTRQRWIVPLAAVGSVLVAGAMLFGVAHHLKAKAAHEVAAAVAAQQEGDVAPPAIEAAHGEPAANAAPAAAKKSAPTGPSQARASLAAGDLDAASSLFEELAENPSTRMDGLNGLAEISRARGDLAGARARYRDILTEAPQYFPAKLGLADTTWELGDKEAARKMYAALEPARMVPARARERSLKH